MTETMDIHGELLRDLRGVCEELRLLQKTQLVAMAGVENLKQQVRTNGGAAEAGPPGELTSLQLLLRAELLSSLQPLVADVVNLKETTTGILQHVQALSREYDSTHLPKSSVMHQDVVARPSEKNPALTTQAHRATAGWTEDGAEQAPVSAGVDAKTNRDGPDHAEMPVKLVWAHVARTLRMHT